MSTFPSHVPPIRPASPRYDAQSNTGATGHIAFVLLCIALAVALILIVLVASELRGSGSQVARHLAQAASIAQMDPPRAPTTAMAQR